MEASSLISTDFLVIFTIMVYLSGMNMSTSKPVTLIYEFGEDKQ